MPCLLDQRFDFLRRKACLISGHLPGKRLIPAACQPSLRDELYQGGVGILKQILPDQLLEITLTDPLAKLLQNPADMQVQKGLTLIIEPGVQQLKPPDQALGITAVISLPKMKLSHIDGCVESPGVNSSLCLIRQSLADDLQKCFLVLRIRSPGCNGKDRLQGSRIIAPVDILSDARVDQRLLDWRARGVQKGIVQNFKGLVEHRIQGRSNCQIVGEIAGALLILLRGNRIGFLQTAHLLKGSLKGNPAVKLDRLIMTQIDTIQIVQLVLRVKITVEIDIGVAGMVISPVKVKEVLIGQIRDTGGISAGFNAIRGVREKGVHDLPL